MRVLTYNVLAQYLCRRDWFPYTPKKVMKWSTRSEMIKAEILSYDADVVCLQELQFSVDPAFNYAEWFETWLRECGYDGVICKNRTDRAFALGVGIFWKRASFEHKFTDTVVLADEIASHCSGGKKSESFKPFANEAYGQVAIRIHLTHKLSGLDCHVATTHLTAPRGDGDYFRKLMQLMQATAFIKWVEEKSLGIPVIVCGDMNCMPDTATYTLFTDGATFGSLEAAATAVDELKVACSIAASNPTPFPNPHHGLRLKSAHHEIYRREPEFTNFTISFKGCLDYVFISEGLNVSAIIQGGYTEEELSKHEGLPSVGHPSDHTPIVVELEFPQPDGNKISTSADDEPSQSLSANNDDNTEDVLA